jgi:hypothetical protein
MIVNSIWDLGIWCEPAESIVNLDMNGDGTAFGNQADKNSSGNESGQTNDGGNENE